MGGSRGEPRDEDSDPEGEKGEGRGGQDSNQERQGLKGTGGAMDHRQDPPSRGSGRQEGQSMGAARAHPFDENAH